MLVLPQQAASDVWVTGIGSLQYDVHWNLFMKGATTLMAISAIAFRILQFPPLHAFCWSIVGFGLGFLAKKSIGHYNFPRSIARAIITLEDRIPNIRLTVFCVSLVVSFVFPLVAALFASVVGVCAGYFFHIHDWGR